MFASKDFKALILRKSGLVEGSSSGKILVPIETKKPLGEKLKRMTQRPITLDTRLNQTLIIQRCQVIVGGVIR